MLQPLQLMLNHCHPDHRSDSQDGRSNARSHRYPNERANSLPNLRAYS